MTDHDRRLVAERAAQAGADVAAASFRRPLDISQKTGPADLVTSADRNAQEAVVAEITAAEPEAVVVAEEDDAPTAVPDDGSAWIVDPIDGTRNYVVGSRVWATCVTAVENGQTVAAATLMPALGDEYVLGPERVTRNGAPVSPSDADDPAAFHVAPLGWWPASGRGEFAALCAELVERVGDIRRVGCAQASLAMVASGELDGAVATGELAPWDAVGGAAMVERAGGTVTDPVGEPWRHDADGLVATNGRAHGTLLEVVAAARA